MPTIEGCLSGMPLQERVAWLALATIAVVHGTFFASVSGAASAEWPVFAVIARFAVALLVQGIVIGLGKTMLSRRDPAEAKAPLDERDRAIAQRALAAACLVLAAEVFVLAMALPFMAGWRITVALLAAIVLADVVRDVATIAGYRRGRG